MCVCACVCECVCVCACVLPRSFRTSVYYSHVCVSPSRHVMSSQPTWWTCCGSSHARGLFPPKKSSEWWTSSAANSAPSICSSNRAPARPLWSCAPASLTQGMCSRVGTFANVCALHQTLQITSQFNTSPNHSQTDIHMNGWCRRPIMLSTFLSTCYLPLTHANQYTGLVCICGCHLYQQYPISAGQWESSIMLTVSLF